MPCTSYTDIKSFRKIIRSTTRKSIPQWRSKNGLKDHFLPVARGAEKENVELVSMTRNIPVMTTWGYVSSAGYEDK